MRPRRGRGPLFPIAAAFLAALLLKSLVVDLALVAGPSMLPTLVPGKAVVVLRAAYGLRLPPGLGGYLLRWSSPRPGHLVVGQDPRNGLAVIKRVRGVRTVVANEGRVETRVFLVGDNPAQSLDSREYGELPVEKIAGRVLVFGHGP